MKPSDKNTVITMSLQRYNKKIPIQLYYDMHKFYAIKIPEDADIAIFFRIVATICQYFKERFCTFGRGRTCTCSLQGSRTALCYKGKCEHYRACASGGSLLSFTCQRTIWIERLVYMLRSCTIAQFVQTATSSNTLVSAPAPPWRPRAGQPQSKKQGSHPCSR